MGVNRLDVELRSPQGVYFPGQTVDGNVVIDAKGEVKVNKIKVEIRGKCRVSWSETTSSYGTTNEDGSTDTHDETTYYTSEESYVNEHRKLELPGCKKDGDKCVLPAGLNRIPFTFKLPKDIPSSFEGKDGWVRYWIKVTLDRPWSFNKSTKKFFSVNYVHDLNALGGMAQPKTIKGSKEFGVLFWKKGSFSAQATLEHAGYVPGEKIMLSLEVENKSKVNIKEVSMEVKQKMKFLAEGRTRHYSKVILRQPIPSKVKAGDPLSWKGRSLALPPLPPSEMKHCSNIFVDYIVTVTFVPSGMHKALEIQLPLVVGNVPLKEMWQHLAASKVAPAAAAGAAARGAGPSAPPAADMAHLPSAPDAPPPFSSVYPNLPPPSYEQVLKEKDMQSLKKHPDADLGKGEEAGGDWEFVPRYLTWNST